MDYFLFDLVAPGQKIRTVYGDGTITAILEGSTHVGFRYKVQMTHGAIAYIRPNAIVHLLPTDVGPYYARNTRANGGFMEFVDLPESSTSNPAKLSKNACQLLFGTDKMYVWLRLYSLLVKLLDISFQTDKKKVSDIQQALMEYIKNEKVDSKTFETTCRSISSTNVHELAVLPRLLEKCTDAWMKVAKEDVLLPLYDFSQIQHLVSTKYSKQQTGRLYIFAQTTLSLYIHMFQISRLLTVKK